MSGQPQPPIRGAAMAASRRALPISTNTIPPATPSGRRNGRGREGTFARRVRKKAHSIGVRVRAQTSDRNTAMPTVTPNWKKNLPIVPLMKATGRKIAMIDSVAAMAAKLISFAPFKAASRRCSPCSRWR